jgi:hypothetical protein
MIAGLLPEYGGLTQVSTFSAFDVKLLVGEMLGEWHAFTMEPGHTQFILCGTTENSRAAKLLACRCAQVIMGKDDGSDVPCSESIQYWKEEK